MKKFLIQALIFIGIMIAIIVLSLFLIPNKKILDNSLYANIDKHKRLDSLPSPKIVFVGGSNFAFGLDSKRVEDSLHLPVVNMGLHAGLGLEFTLNEVKNSIKKGDIIVVSPVYEWIKEGNDLFYGETVLVALLFDVNRSDLQYVSMEQAIHLFPKTITYGVSKLFPKNLDVMQGGADWYEKIFKRTAFNKYGDETLHWKYPKQTIKVGNGEDKSELSMKAIKYLRKYKLFVEKRGAKLYIVPPSLMNYPANCSFANKLSDQLKRDNMQFAIEPDSCVMNDSLFFNTAYHLNKQGVYIYTKMLIEKVLK